MTSAPSQPPANAPAAVVAQCALELVRQAADARAAALDASERAGVRLAAAVRCAQAAGIGLSAIAPMTGLSRQGVYLLLERVPDAGNEAVR